MNLRKRKKIVTLFILTLLLFAFSLICVICANENTVFLRDGGGGDGSSYENAVGDFKSAVKLLANTGGKIVICGKYTYNELITLSDRSGTSNGDRVITVTSVYNGVDYRKTNDAMICAGDENGSANMVLAGSFIFEDLNIVTGGSQKARAIICYGYDTVFGEGIVCKRQSDAPYISVVGGHLSEELDRSGTGGCSLVIRSGTYNYVCVANRSSNFIGDTSLTIDGGVFEGDVSVSGLDNESTVQDGNGVLIINGGSFSGAVGALTGLTGDFLMTVNGGVFKKEIIALGKNNIIDINGGDLKNIDLIRLADFIDLPPETDGSGQTTENKEPDDSKKPTVNINNYEGDVSMLVEKIQGKGVFININTQGGSDIQTAVQSEITLPDNQDNTSSVNGSDKIEYYDTDDGQIARKYFIGSYKGTVIAVILFAAIIFLAVIVLAYRIVYRKK